MSSLHVLGEEWSLKRSLASLWARRRLAWLVWPALFALIGYALIWIVGAFLKGMECFHTAFLTDYLVLRPPGFSPSEWEIYRSDILSRAWLFTVFLFIVAVVIVAVVHYTIMARVQRRRVAKAEEERRALDRIEQRGFEAGQRSEQSRVYSAVIHAFKPKVTLPEVPEGCRREFYIRVRLAHPGAIPTGDRRIRFSDIPESAVFWGAIGAPHYDQIVGEPGKLVILDVVYTLDDRPIVGFGE